MYIFTSPSPSSFPLSHVNNKGGRAFRSFRAYGFSVTSVAEGARPRRRYQRRARRLGHVRQISPNARDGGYRRALSRIFYLRRTRGDISARFLLPRASRVLHFIERQLDISNTPSADVLVIPYDVTRCYARVIYLFFFFFGRYASARTTELLRLCVSSKAQDAS